MAVGLLGYGAIGRTVAESILEGRAGHSVLTAVLCRNLQKHRGTDHAVSNHPDIVFTDTPEAFFTPHLDLVIEAAGQDALRQYGDRVLSQGIDLLITSIGAFTDEAFFQALVDCADQNDARLFLASGALPAVDWMGAAGLSPIHNVEITQSKPLHSWRGTPAEKMVNLDEVTEATCFFEGTARESASRFPKSSNITAMLALSTAGMDHTRVKLVADPKSAKMHTRITFDGDAGGLNVEWYGVPSKMNPSTSADVPLTVIKALRNLTSTVCYGV